MLFLLSTSNDSDAVYMLAVASVPPVYVTSQLDEGICVFLALGKLGYGEVFSSFDERRPA